MSAPLERAWRRLSGMSGRPTDLCTAVRALVLRVDLVVGRATMTTRSGSRRSIVVALAAAADDENVAGVLPPPRSHPRPCSGPQRRRDKGEERDGDENCFRVRCTSRDQCQLQPVRDVKTPAAPSNAIGTRTRHRRMHAPRYSLCCMCRPAGPSKLSSYVGHRCSRSRDSDRPRFRLRQQHSRARLSLSHHTQG